MQRLFSSAVTTTAVSFNALKTAKMNESSDATEELSEKQKELRMGLMDCKKRY